MRLRVPGSVYNECLDPLTTQVPGEEGWTDHYAGSVSRGYGFQHLYDAPVDLCSEIVEYVIEWAEGLTSGGDPESNESARRVLQWAQTSGRAAIARAREKGWT